MTQPEEQFKSLQIFRPVIDTEALRGFMEVADAIGRCVFKAETSVLLAAEETEATLGISDDAEIGDDDDMDIEVITTRTVGVARHKLHDLERLKLLLLDRRNYVADSKPLIRAYEKFMLTDSDWPVPVRKNRRPPSTKPPLDWRLDLRRAGLAHDITEYDELKIKCDFLTSEHNPGYGKRGREVSLASSSFAPEALLLIDEAEVCFNALASINPRVALPTSKTTNAVSFIRLPRDATDRQVARYAELVGKRLPLTLHLGEPRLALT
ncbi:MAG TPA: hypothetical protein VFL85_04875 [Candidatus Saccharimonadales bacterium]|nr:hypothetical protein [Candidatus Saccharimonadales bacterium]